MYNKNIFIHIGYPKSASTTLQKQLFNKHPDINYLGIYPTGNIGQDSSEIDLNCSYLKDEKLRQFHYNLVMLEGIEYASSNNIQLFTQYILPYFNNAKVPVLSNERFTSIFFAHPDRAEKARRIKELFPNAKIIIIIRNQIDIIKSQYRDHPFDPRCFAIGKPVSIDKWITLDLRKESMGYISTLNYYQLVKYYSKLFGRDSVGVFLFDELVNDLQTFAKKLSDFIGIDHYKITSLLETKHENLGVSHRYNRYRRFRRQFLPQTSLGIIIPKAVKKKLIELLKKGASESHEISPALVQKAKFCFP